MWRWTCPADFQLCSTTEGSPTGSLRGATGNPRRSVGLRKAHCTLNGSRRRRATPPHLPSFHSGLLWPWAPGTVRGKPGNKTSENHKLAPKLTPTCPVRATQDGLKVHQLAQGEVSNSRPSRNPRKDSVLNIIHKEHSSPYKQFNGPVTHKPPQVILAVTGCGHSPNSKDYNASVLKPLSAQCVASDPWPRRNPSPHNAGHASITTGTTWFPGCTH